MPPSVPAIATHTAPIVILYDSFGAYHIARLKAAQAELPVVGVEIGSRSDDYPWFDSLGDDAPLFRLFPGKSSAVIEFADLRRALFDRLDALRPAVVAVPGWGTPAALLALEWCARRRCPAVMMCDSTAADARRRGPIEAVKRAVVGSCGAGFASGSRSTAYLASLGLPVARVTTGYDVVDNAHFAAGAAVARADRRAACSKLGLPESYILSLGRLIEKKNLPTLLRGYAHYREIVGASAYPLVIGGSGPLDAELRTLVATLELADTVYLAGHVDYDDLPACYGLARCFALVSSVEQWGLVVNEALAAAVPVLVSTACGAAPDLVVPGSNGELCDPSDSAEIGRKLAYLCHEVDSAAYSAASQAVADTWGLPRFVAGLVRASAIAIGRRKGPRLLPVLLASALLRIQARRRPAGQ